MAEPILLETGVAALICGLYVVIAGFFLRSKRAAGFGNWGFAITNLVAAFTLFFIPDWMKPQHGLGDSLIRFSIYVSIGVAHFRLLQRLPAKQSEPVYWTALLFPILGLLAVKLQSVLQLAGVSYMAFRMAQTAMVVRNDPGARISLADYTGFLFFPPTLPVGPISPINLYLSGIEASGVSGLSIARGLTRIAVGYLMYRFLAPVPQQLTFSNLWTDGYTHGAADFLISSYCYLFYLFFNFSGACHVAIGVAGLLGIPVKENFNDPFLARSIKDFWNRWHISLSEFVRDLVFTPASMFLTRLAPSLALLATLTAGMPTFVVIGLWHGLQPGFAVFGLLHGLGFCTNIAFEAFLRKRKWRKLQLFDSWAWVSIARFLTITYIALTMVFVEYPDLGQLSKMLQVWDGPVLGG